MSEQQLINALNECLDRIAGGQSIDDCLEIYPDLADELRPLLEVGQLPRQARPDTNEMNQMRNRLDAYIEDYITSTDFDNPTWHIPQGGIVFSLVASLVLVIGLMFILRDNTITVANTPTPTLTMTASATLTETRMPTIEPIVTATEFSTKTETSSPTLTITATMTSVPTETMIPPSAAPTNTVQPTSTFALPTSTREIPTVSQTEIELAEDCIPEKPDGWFDYQIRTGDTLSYIAMQSDSTIELLSEVNCIEDGRFIVVGQTVFVPQLWEIEPSNDTSPSMTDNTSSTSSSHNSSSSDDDSDDDHDDDDDDHDDDDD